MKSLATVESCGYHWDQWRHHASSFVPGMGDYVDLGQSYVEAELTLHGNVTNSIMTDAHSASGTGHLLVPYMEIKLELFCNMPEFFLFGCESTAK